MDAAEEKAVREASSNVSEHLKQVSTAPLLALHEVQTHIRERGLLRQVVVRDELLQTLTNLREGAASASRSCGEMGQNGSKCVKAAADRVEKLSGRIAVLQERLEIVSDIHRDVQKPKAAPSRLRRAWQRSGLGRREETSEADSLPIGVGQGLDNELIHGEVDIDEYAMQISKLARTFAELEEANNRKLSKRNSSGSASGSQK